MEVEPSVQSSFYRQNICNSGQKIRRSSYQSFLLLSNFSLFLYFHLFSSKYFAQDCSHLILLK